jgi:hypothetical protein
MFGFNRFSARMINRRSHGLVMLTDHNDAFRDRSTRNREDASCTQTSWNMAPFAFIAIRILRMTATSCSTTQSIRISLRPGKDIRRSPGLFAMCSRSGGCAPRYWTLAKNSAHYHGKRNHQGKSKNCSSRMPTIRSKTVATLLSVTERLGGLLKFYGRARDSLRGKSVVARSRQTFPAS